MRKQQLKQMIKEELKAVVKEASVAKDIKALTKLLQKKDAKITIDKKSAVYVNGVKAFNADDNKSAASDYKYRYRMLKQAYDKSQ
jgi:UDP-N-acetylglucosamine enolpyruvyl transferase